MVPHAGNCYHDIVLIGSPFGSLREDLDRSTPVLQNSEAGQALTDFTHALQRMYVWMEWIAALLILLFTPELLKWAEDSDKKAAAKKAGRADDAGERRKAVNRFDPVLAKIQIPTNIL